jgi:phosphoribosyl-ATP pyrophosphohydrolase/phosphoribosyl-AMP cyclohydrolase
MPNIKAQTSMPNSKSQISNAKYQSSQIEWDERGLVPAIVQDVTTDEVLTLAYMNPESLQLTLESGETWFWSRSRGELWHKGATSGNTQRVVEIRYDCDGDTLLVRVEPAGPACHTGERSCFHQVLHELDDK